MYADCKLVGISHEEAEILAVRALGFLAQHQERVEGFVRMTGVEVDDLKDHLSDPRYLGAVLDYLLADERYLLEFAERVGIAPELPYAARRKLEGAIPIC